MENAIKAIYQWQVDAGNAARPYNDFLESSFQVEEAIEGFSPRWECLYDDYGNVIIDNTEQDTTAKDLSRSFMSWIDDGCSTLSDVERLDKACDAIVFAIGSMAKLGLNAQQIQQALLVVNQANKAKLGCPRDEHGKLLKPDDFDEKYAPEPKLQAILDKRGK